MTPSLEQGGSNGCEKYPESTEILKLETRMFASLVMPFEITMLMS